MSQCTARTGTHSTRTGAARCPVHKAAYAAGAPRTPARPPFFPYPDLVRPRTALPGASGPIDHGVVFDEAMLGSDDFIAQRSCSYAFDGTDLFLVARVTYYAVDGDDGEGWAAAGDAEATLCTDRDDPEGSRVQSWSFDIPPGDSFDSVGEANEAAVEQADLEDWDTVGRPRSSVLPGGTVQIAEMAAEVDFARNLRTLGIDKRNAGAIEWLLANGVNLRNGDIPSADLLESVKLLHENP